MQPPTLTNLFTSRFSNTNLKRNIKLIAICWLLTAGIVPYQTAFKILSYLKREVDYVPWKAALDSLAFIETMFMHTGGYGALQVRNLPFIKNIFLGDLLKFIFHTFITS